MQNIELRIMGPYPADEVRHFFEAPDSGINLAANYRKEGAGVGQADQDVWDFFRKPNRSMVGAIVTIGGLIINTAQLALKIYEICQKRRDKKTAVNGPQSVQIQIVTAGDILNVPVNSAGEIEEFIIRHVVNVN